MSVNHSNGRTPPAGNGQPIQPHLPPSFRATHFWKAMEVGQEKQTAIEFRKTPMVKRIKKHFDAFCKIIESGPNVQQTPSIPHTAHFVWIGKRETPEYTKQFAESVQKYNPGWKVKIWTNADIWERSDKMKGLQFPFYSDKTKDAFINGANWAEKVDILRYEILYQQGGVYFDADMECFSSLHDIHQNGVKFYCGFEGDQCYGERSPLIGNAIIGSEAKHPIMRGCLEKLISANEVLFGTKTIERTGPQLLTEQVAIHLSQRSTKKGSVLALPPMYFYPRPFKDRTIISMHSCVINGTLAGHYFDADWNGTAKNQKNKMALGSGKILTSWGIQDKFGQLRVIFNPDAKYNKKRTQFHLENMGISKAEYEVKQYSEHSEEGETGRIYNHLEVIKEVNALYQLALANGSNVKKYKTLFVLEHNVGAGTLRNGAPQLAGIASQFEQAFHELPENWEHFSLMATCDKKVKKVDKHLARLKKGQGAIAYALHARAYPKVIKYLELKLQSEKVIGIDQLIGDLSTRIHNPLVSYGTVKPLVFIENGKSDRTQPSNLKT